MKILSYIQFKEIDESVKWLEDHNAIYALCNLRKSIFVSTNEGEIEAIPGDYIFTTDTSRNPIIYTEEAFKRLLKEQN